MSETDAQNPFSNPEGSTTFVPGQAVLPGFEEVLRIESAVLKKPEQERFCWEFVTNGGKAGPAYQVAINPESELLNAQKRASELLKKPEIAGRIKDISSIIQRKYEHEVLGSCLKAMNFDPGVYFDAKGYAKGIHALPENTRRGVGLEAKMVDGCLVYLPVFPSPEKARDALAKMFGMNKDKTEVSVGVDGLRGLLDEISSRHEHRDIVKERGGPA